MMDYLIVDGKLSWRPVALLVALTTYVLVADLVWRMTSMGLARLAAVLAPLGAAWLGVVAWVIRP
jgi:hypothetical protein